MENVLLASIPALITGLISYFTARYQSRNEIKSIKIKSEEELKKLREDNENNYQTLEKQMEHDLKKLEKERKEDLEFYKGQLEANAKFDAETKQNELIYSVMEQALNGNAEKVSDDMMNFADKLYDLNGDVQKNKMDSFLKSKKK